MTDLAFIRGQNGLIPDGQDAADWFAKVKPGARIAAKVSVPRNGRFHRKFFAMLNVAYANWDKPTVQTPLGEAQCSFGKFRNDVCVLAGYGEPVVNTRGEVRYHAKSIAFHNMDEAEFSDLYSAVCNVILQRFLPSWKADDLDKAAEAFILGFG